MNEEQEVSVGVVGHDQQLVVQFSDGQYAIPAHALDVLGGLEYLIKIAPALNQKTFSEFIGAVHLIMQKDMLNAAQQTIIADHFQNSSRDKTSTSLHSRTQ